MNSSKIIKVSIGVYFALVIGTLVYFDNSSVWSGIVAGAITGAGFGIIRGQFFGLLHPSEQTFRRRYIYEGLAWGLFLMVINFSVYHMVSGPFDFIRATVASLAGFIICLTLFYFWKTKRIEKHKREISRQSAISVNCCDIAELKNTTFSNTSGYLVLTDDDIWFLSKQEEELMHLDAKEASPSLVYTTNIYTKWFNIPTGLNLNDKEIINLRFPYYWKSKIQQVSA